MRNRLLLALCLVPSLAFGEGGELFNDVCAACHGEAGVGTPGFAPPLNIAGFWQDLGEEAPRYLAGVMASGLAGNITAGGETFIGLMMPPQSAIEPADLAEIGRYVLGDLGGLDAAFTEAMVLAARETPPSHADLRGMRPKP